MALTLTYDPQLSRVSVAATGLGNADRALIERSTNQVRWTTVRGGRAAVVIGGQTTVFDYEFIPNVINYYRVTTAADIVKVGAGAAALGDNQPITPALPAGIQAGDVLLMVAAIHNEEGSPDTPAGWTLLRNLNPFRLFGKIAGAGEAAPTVTWTGGTAGPTGAQIAALRNAKLDNGGSGQFNPALQQNIPYNSPPDDIPVPGAHSAIVYIGWKHHDWNSVNVLPGDGGVATRIGEFKNFLNNHSMGVVWDWCIQDTADPVDVKPGEFVVVGGISEISRGMVVVIPPQDLVQTANITPVLDQPWLKSTAKPFLNTPILLGDKQPLERKSRAGVFDVIGRAAPIAVSDVRGARQTVLTAIAETQDARRHLELLLATGDIVFLHVPPGYPMPSMYAAVGDTIDDWAVGVYRLPMTEVAAPGPDVVGAAVTWLNIINSYGTWADLIADKATWQAVLDIVGEPEDIPVP